MGGSLAPLTQEPEVVKQALGFQLRTNKRKSFLMRQLVEPWVSSPKDSVDLTFVHGFGSQLGSSRERSPSRFTKEMFGLCFHCLLPVPVYGCSQNQGTGLQGPLAWPQKLILLFFGNSLSLFFGNSPFLESFPSLDRVLVSQSFTQLWSSANSLFSPVHATLSPCQLSVPMLPASPTARQVSTSTDLHNPAPMPGSGSLCSLPFLFCHCNLG